MNFSAKAEYGVRLMIELGRRQSEQAVPLKAISEAENLPLPYLEHVVADLKAAGLVESSRGAHGGYRLARPAAAIDMAEVVQALEGPIAPMDCFGRSEEHTSELQSRLHLVCRLPLEKKKRTHV